MKLSIFLRFRLLAICLFLSAAAFSQKIDPAFLPYRSFLSGDTDRSLQGGEKYFIALLGKAEMHDNTAAQKFTIMRQLSDSVFIISVNDAGKILFDFPFAGANNNWKLSPLLLDEICSGKNIFPAVFLITFSENNDIEDWLHENNFLFKKTTAGYTYTVKVNTAKAFHAILANSFIHFISRLNTHPKTELQINTLDLSNNRINLLHSRLPTLTGSGLVVSIKENTPDTTDIDIPGRYISNPLASPIIDPHSTIMATMAGGAGNSWYLGLGVAPGAGITSSDFSNLLPDPDINYQQYHINVQNHSYGVGVENFYGADAAAFDASALTNDKLLFVFSAGNSGTQTASAGQYAGISKVANLTGSFKMAKNIITVGATDSFYHVVDPSSKGPAYDGRVKPEMAAYGQDGSSGAAALVSGTALILQQAYQNNNAGALPSSALVKAVLLNSADDIGSPGIDFTSGFGALNAYKAAEGMNAGRYYIGTVSGGTSQNFSLAIPPNLKKVKLTLVWNDIPASPNAFVALKNDLDLRVTAVSSGQVFLPWVLNSSPNIDSLHLLPVRKRDSLNTVEQVSIDDPAAGNYTITVNGFSIPGAPQKFSVAYQFDTANNFSWHFPAAADNIFPAAQNLLRWATTFSNTTGNIDYSSNNGISWLPVAAGVDLSTGYLRWNAPDTNALALLRMKIGSNFFISDTFTISARPDLRVGFNCTDSVFLYWNKNKGISRYQLFGLGSKYLQPLVQVTDTQFVFRKTDYPYLNFAVAGFLGSKRGVKSYTIDYRNQGVECYVSNFTADLINGNAGNIQLEIGTTYLVSKIVFEKSNAGSFIPLFEINSISGLHYSTIDTHLSKGINTYRAAVYLSDGRVIYSRTTDLLYFENDPILVFPNPVTRGGFININFLLLNNQNVTLFDVTGRKIFYGKASTTSFLIPAEFPKGLYLLQISDPETNLKKTYKIIII